MQLSQHNTNETVSKKTYAAQAASRRLGDGTRVEMIFIGFPS
jgi:hypothetical protein